MILDSLLTGMDFQVMSETFFMITLFTSIKPTSKPDVKVT